MNRELPYFYIGMFHAYRGKNVVRSGFGSTLAYNDEEADVNFALMALTTFPEKDGWTRHGHQFARHDLEIEYVSPFTGERGRYRLKVERISGS